jgi:hypothetical protein
MKSIQILAFALLTGLVACAPDAGDDVDLSAETQADAIATYPTISFNTDGTVTQTGRLVAGSRVRVRYVQSRLTTCRESYQGRVAWTISGFASVNGETAHTFETASVNPDGTRRTTTTALVSLPSDGDLALWFQNTSRSGCVDWDSHDGANYHFTIAPSSEPPPAVPTITFRADGTIVQSGSLRAGSSVKVHYDLDRLTQCRGTMGGYPQWSISGFASSNGGTAQSFETSVAAANGTRTTIDATIQLASAGDLALWFENTNRWGCNAWDSNYGNNFHFVVLSR